MGRGDVFCTMECKNCGKEIPEDSTFARIVEDLSITQTGIIRRIN